MGGEIKLECAKSSFDYKKLCPVAKGKLVESDFISISEPLSLTPCHNIILNGQRYTHYVINCLSSRKKYFLKVSKGNDTSSHCNDYLKSFRNQHGEYIYPVIIVPEFKFNDVNFFITNYIEGQSLDVISETLTSAEWIYIAKELLVRIDELSSIHANYYSDQNVFTHRDCLAILMKKFPERLKHIVFNKYSRVDLKNAYHRCINILNNSFFTKPTLLHMDVKPANIIYNSQTGFVTLIDFEFARFGDYDYGWTQILLSGINAFNQEYKEYVVPYMTQNRINLKEAINVPKFRCYLFYQTACNLIYYHDHNTECPHDMVRLFEKLLVELSKEQCL